MRLRVVLGALVVSLASCGGSPPTVAPTVAVTPPPKPVAPPPEPAADVSAVPPPAGLGVTVHLAHPRATMQQLTGVLGSLAALLSGGGSADPEALVALAAGAPIGKLVDLDQPVDLAVSDLVGEGSARIAGSGVLADPATARETLEKYFTWTPTGPGVVRLTPREDADGGPPRPCMLTPAYSAHPRKGEGGADVPSVRIVCGDGEAAVRHLGPYLARTMPRIASSADFRLEVFAKELREPDKGPRDHSGADPADELFDELGDKLVDDVGTVVLEASSDGQMLDVTVSTAFSSATSALTRAFLGQGAPAAGAPPAFERLPRDASFAWYGRGASAGDLEPLRKAIFDSLRKWSIDDGYAPSAVDTLVAPLQQLALTGGPWSVAAGHKTDVVRAAVDAAIDGKTPAARAKARAALQGWVVAAVEEPSAKWIDGVRQVVKNDAIKAANKPRVKHDPQKETWKLAVTTTPAPLGLPAGTLHVEARVTQNAAWVAAQRKAKLPLGDPVVPHTEHLFVVPDGARTWLALAEDPALAAAQVNASLAGAPATGTLASRRDLDGLRAMPASSAGFLSVAGVALWAADGDTDEELKKTRQTIRGLASLTAGGTTPVPLAYTSLPKPGAGAAAGGEARLRVVFPLALGVELATSNLSIF